MVFVTVVSPGLGPADAAVEVVAGDGSPGAAVFGVVATLGTEAMSAGSLEGTTSMLNAGRFAPVPDAAGGSIDGETLLSAEP
jgi:hypothetical protein